MYIYRFGYDFSSAQTVITKILKYESNQITISQLEKAAGTSGTFHWPELHESLFVDSILSIINKFSHRIY